MPDSAWQAVHTARPLTAQHQDPAARGQPAQAAVAPCTSRRPAQGDAPTGSTQASVRSTSEWRRYDPARPRVMPATMQTPFPGHRQLAPAATGQAWPMCDRCWRRGQANGRTTAAHSVQPDQQPVPGAHVLTAASCAANQRIRQSDWGVMDDPPHAVARGQVRSKPGRLIPRRSQATQRGVRHAAQAASAARW